MKSLTLPLAAILLLCAHGVPARAAETNSDAVQVARVSADPAVGSGILMFVVEVAGKTSGGERTYHIPFMGKGQAKPREGQLCTIDWVPGGKADALTAEGKTVFPYYVVRSFSCRD